MELLSIEIKYVIIQSILYQLPTCIKGSQSDVIVFSCKRDGVICIVAVHISCMSISTKMYLLVCQLV